MSGGSSNVAGWFTRLEPSKLPADFIHRADDPKLGEAVEFWSGNLDAFQSGRPVLIGFPQDEGVRRNGGREGAAEAPGEIRRWLYRLTKGDCQAGVSLPNSSLLDVGDIRIVGDLECSQNALAEVVGGVLAKGAILVVLGGGHEAAFGHYLGYVSARKKVGIVNLDAHLDVRPLIEGKGHSGSPFRQAIKNDSAPLPRGNYYCLGVQPHTMAREHLDFMREHDCKISWASEVEGNLGKVLQSCHDRVAGNEHSLFVSLDADVVRMADMPGVSSPNPTGLSGTEVLAAARIAGALPKVTSFEIVEINPRFDRDGQSARWAALAVWNFLIGLASRGSRWEE